MSTSPQPVIIDDTDAESYTDNLHEDVFEEDLTSDVDPAEKERLASEQAVFEFLSPLRHDDTTLHSLAHRFAAVYKKLALNSDEQFLPTPVTKLPDGHEVGRYLAIDVGGSNLRVSFIELLGDASNAPPKRPGKHSTGNILSPQPERVKRTLEKAWPIGEHLKKDNAEDLFSWIGDCIAEVVADSLTSDDTKGQVPEVLDMGLTFSFPIM